ncbi:hypothetical protein ACOSQ2_028401 [Xanthoceras sorbifolium]
MPFIEVVASVIVVWFFGFCCVVLVLWPEVFSRRGAEPEGQEAGPIHKEAATNHMESFVADDCVLSGDFVSKISSIGVRETGTEQRGVQNAGVVLGSVGDTVLITGTDTGGEVSVLLSYDSIIDSNSTDTVLITGANTGEKVNVLPGCDTIIDSNSAVVHAKGKMVEYGIVCSPKHREWKRLAREKARKRRSEGINNRLQFQEESKWGLWFHFEAAWAQYAACREIVEKNWGVGPNPLGSIAIVVSKLEGWNHLNKINELRMQLHDFYADGKEFLGLPSNLWGAAGKFLLDFADTAGFSSADIAAAGSLAVAALARSSVAAVVVLDAAGTSLAVVAPFASGATVPRFSNTGSRQSLLGTTQDNRWVPPICGSFKLNVDAAFDVACGKFGKFDVACGS